MITDVNPFIFSHPLAPDDIIDRDEETNRLLAAAVGGHYVRLYAPRKYGKTSLLRRVLRDGEREEGMLPILIDLYGVLSVKDVAIRFERAYARQLKGRTRARVEEFLQSTGLGLSLGALGISARLQLDPKGDPLPALHALLDLPLRLEESGGFRALIVLDEFQDITKVAGMDALLRSHIQFQGEIASFVFAGSEPRPDAGALREPGAPALRPGHADAARPACGRRHRAVRRRAVPGDRPRRRRGAEPPGCGGPRASAAHDVPRPSAVGAGRAGRGGDARGLGRRPRNGSRRAAAGVRRQLATALDERAEGAARRARGRGARRFASGCSTSSRCPRARSARRSGR